MKKVSYPFMYNRHLKLFDDSVLIFTLCTNNKAKQETEQRKEERVIAEIRPSLMKLVVIEINYVIFNIFCKSFQPVFLSNNN